MFRHLLFAHIISAVLCAVSPGADPKNAPPKEKPPVPERPAPTAKSPFPVEFRADDQKELEVRFPSGDENWETAWKIAWDVETIGEARKQGFKFPKDRRDKLPILFKIKAASFKPGRDAPWIQVLDDAHVSEFYVPYFFKGTRFFDLRDHGNYVRLHQPEAGPRGRVLGKAGLAIGEFRDRGLVYKYQKFSRRGEEFALWANCEAGNYTYLAEFGFSDDGTVAFRHSPTGYNLPSHPHVPHMHNSCWRVGVRLGPDGKKDSNTVALAKWPRLSPGVVVPDADTDPTYGVEPIKAEGYCDWDPREFTKVRVMNPDYAVVGKGRLARPISYDLVPLVTGIARHPRADEKFSMHDFWITRADTPVRQYTELSEEYFVKNGKPLDGGPVVIWHMASLLHLPRAEDGYLAKSAAGSGQALTTWSAFELRPRNLFATTPIYRSAK